MGKKAKLALAEAIKAIYFDYSRDYESYLWNIVEILGGKKAADLLESNEHKAYKKYVESLEKRHSSRVDAEEYQDSQLLPDEYCDEDAEKAGILKWFQDRSIDIWSKDERNQNL